MFGIRHSTPANCGFLGSLFGGMLRLTAAYQRVRIGAAESKWKPNGNIAASIDSAINVSS